jgi:hypothetical protein
MWGERVRGVDVRVRSTNKEYIKKGSEREL